MHATRATSVAVLFVSLGVACSSASAPGRESGETTGAQSEAVWTRGADGSPVASNDVSTPAANAVVRIPRLVGGVPDPNDTGCTGVLLTQTLLLTSKYCVSSTKGGLQPTVQIGASSASFTTRSAASDAVLMPPSAVNSLDGGDLALVVLQPPTPAQAALVQPQHPSLVPPASSGAGAARTFPEITMVGWSSLPFAGPDEPQNPVPAYAQNRQAASLQNANVVWLSADDASYGPFFARAVTQGYDPATATIGLQAGDFGGPLYAYASAGSAPQLVGIATTAAISFERPTPEPTPGAPLAGTHCTAGLCDVWVDLTAPATRQWLEANAANTAHDAAPNWNKSHPRADGLVRNGNVPDWWLGESDGNFGPCTAADSDCDGWNDRNPDGTQRDNCPTTPNPDQADANDDGVGDACPTVCVPKTRAAACGQYECGKVSDGCGGTWSCGTFGGGCKPDNRSGMIYSCDAPTHLCVVAYECLPAGCHPGQPKCKCVFPQ